MNAGCFVDLAPSSLSDLDNGRLDQRLWRFGSAPCRCGGRAAGGTVRLGRQVTDRAELRVVRRCGREIRVSRRQDGQAGRLDGFVFLGPGDGRLGDVAAVDEDLLHRGGDGSDGFDCGTNWCLSRVSWVTCRPMINRLSISKTAWRCRLA